MKNIQTRLIKNIFNISNNDIDNIILLMKKVFILMSI